MSQYYKWDKDAVLELASIFDSMVDFRLSYHGAYKYATRHGFLDEVRAIVLRETEDVDELKRRLTMELDSSRRHFLTANRSRSVGTVANDETTGHVDIQVGNYLDHDISHWEQAGEEREERALDWIEQLIKHGTEEDVAAAWEQYGEHQVYGRLGNTKKRLRRGTNTRRQGGK